MELKSKRKTRSNRQQNADKASKNDKKEDKKYKNIKKCNSKQDLGADDINKTENAPSQDLATAKVNGDDQVAKSINNKNENDLTQDFAAAKTNRDAKENEPSQDLTAVMVNKNEEEEELAQDEAAAKINKNGKEASKKMNVAEYLKSALQSSYTLQEGEIKIGNTIFLASGRLLIPKEILLFGKLAVNQKQGLHPYMWSKNSTPQALMISRKIAPYESGPLSAAREVETELAAFSIYVTEEMLQDILTYTNEEIKISEYYISPKPTYAYPVTITELKAFIGILYLSAVKKDNKVSTSFLWGVCGSDIYSTIMSKERFDFLLKSLRFNEYATRNIKKQNDSFAEIREVWDVFIKKCSEVYRPSANCTVGEMFVDFNGKCKFKWTLPSRPHKCGLKLIMLCDSNDRYIMSGIPYLDKNKNGAMSLADYMVEKLVTPLCGTNINITYDSDWFTSISLAKNMFIYYKLTTVGILNNSLSEIPPDMTVEKNRPLGTSIFVYNVDDGLQLCSYYPDKKEMYLFISNLHFNTMFVGTEKKPKVSEYYESTKNGVNSIIKMLYGSSCNRQSTHWFMSIFCTILDFAGINALTILNSNRSRHGKSIIRRVDYLYKLGLDLILPYLNEKLIDPDVDDSVKNKVKKLIDEREKMNIHSNTRKQMGKGAKMKVITEKQADRSMQAAASRLQTKSEPRLQQKDATVKKQINQIFESELKPKNESGTQQVDTPNFNRMFVPVTRMSHNPNMWDEIRELYSPAPLYKHIDQVRPGLQNNYQTNFTDWLPGTATFYLSTNLGIMQSPPITSYFNFGFSSRNFNIQQGRGIYAPYPSIMTMQSNVTNLTTTWHLPNIAGQQKPNKDTNPPMNSILLQRPVSNTHPCLSYKKEQTYQFKKTSEEMFAISVTSQYSSNVENQSNMQGFTCSSKSVLNEPGQSNTSSKHTQPVLANCSALALDGWKAASVNTDAAPSQQAQQATAKFNRELSVCGVCNYIGNRNLITDCVKCAVLLCPVHRKTVCTYCVDTVQAEIANPVIGAKGKCEICNPKGNIEYSTQCYKCLKFLCLEHRRVVCLFCIEI